MENQLESTMPGTGVRGKGFWYLAFFYSATSIIQKLYFLFRFWNFTGASRHGISKNR